MLMMFVLSCKTWNVVKPGAWLVGQGPSRGSTVSRFVPYLICGAPVAKLVKNPSATRETWVRSLGWEDPLEKGKATHHQYSGLENSMDCIVYGVTKSRTRLSDLHFHFQVLHSQQAVRAASRQVRSKARGCSALSLKPKQGHLFNFPNSHSLLQGIFPIQGSNPGLPHCRQILYQLGH